MGVVHIYWTRFGARETVCEMKPPRRFEIALGDDDVLCPRCMRAGSWRTWAIRPKFPNDKPRKLIKPVKPLPPKPEFFRDGI